MALTRSFPTQYPSGLPITDTRRVTAGLVVRNADGTPRAGVFPAHANTLVTGRATAPLMAYDVAPFLAATSRINTGVELIANDASTTITTTAAPASNSRIDVIWVRAQFVQHADANNDVVFGVTQGVAALTPTKPAIPTGALELATAVITSTTVQTSTAVITSTHPFTASAGGVVMFRSRTEMDAWAAPDGALARDLTTGDLYKRTVGAWRSQEGGSRLIIPSGVSGGTVVDGLIQPTAGATTIGINGVFSSRFRRYKVIAQWSTSGGNGGATMKLTTGGVVASGNYNGQFLGANGNTPLASYTGGSDSMSATAHAGTSHFGEYTFANPAHPSFTYMNELVNTYPAGVTTFGYSHAVSTAYDGFALTLSAGLTFAAGEIAIYALA